MLRRRRRVLAERSLPLSGILAAMFGFVLLLCYWKFSRYTEEWTELGRLTFVAVGVLLTLWGSKQIVTSFRRRRSALFGTFARRRSRGNENRVLLTREGAVFLVIIALLLVGSLIGHSNMLMLLFALMAGPFVLNGWATFTMLKRLKVSRHVPARAMAGQPVSVEIELENRRRYLSSWVMVVHDQVANLDESLRPGALFARVPAGETRTASYQMCLMQRGRYRFGPIHVGTRFPLGLVERGLIVEERGEILIYPRVGRMNSEWKRKQLIAAELVQRPELQRGTYDDDFHRIREYRWGDNPRAIHWRTSARHNELMVCEYRQNRVPRLVILLDLWQPRRPSERDLQQVELAVSLSATMSVEYLREGRNPRLFLIVAGQSLMRWEGRSGPGNLDSLLETLAIAEAGPSPPVEEMIEGAAGVRTPGTRTFFITTRPADETPDWRLDDGPRGNPSENGSDLQMIAVNEEKISSYFQLE